MNAADQIRKNLSLFEAQAPTKPESKKSKDIKTTLSTLRRQFPSTARYDFGSSWTNFESVLKDIPGHVNAFRRKAEFDAQKLQKLLDGIRKDERLTDKEHYLREGYESRGFSNRQVVLCWFKEKGEHLFVFAPDNDSVALIRDFLRHFGCIR